MAWQQIKLHECLVRASRIQRCHHNESGRKAAVWGVGSNRGRRGRRNFPLALHWKHVHCADRPDTQYPQLLTCLVQGDPVILRYLARRIRSMVHSCFWGAGFSFPPHLYGLIRPTGCTTSPCLRNECLEPGWRTQIPQLKQAATFPEIFSRMHEPLILPVPLPRDAFRHHERPWAITAHGKPWAWWVLRPVHRCRAVPMCHLLQ